MKKSFLVRAYSEELVEAGLLDRIKKQLKKVVLGLIASGALFSGSAKAGANTELAKQIDKTYKEAHGWDFKTGINVHAKGEGSQANIRITDKETKDEVIVEIIADKSGKPVRVYIGTWAGEDRMLDSKMQEVAQEQHKMWKEIYPQISVKVKN